MKLIWSLIDGGGGRESLSKNKQPSGREKQGLKRQRSKFNSPNKKEWNLHENQWKATAFMSLSMRRSGG